jgi:hypothetical protein
LRRLIASIAIFAGWAGLPLAALSGLVGSEFLGLNALDGPPPPTAVYGISAALIMWVLVFAALIVAVPLVAALFSVGPSHAVYWIAGGMVAVGVVMIPDPLGASFGLPLVAGGAATAFGAWLLAADFAAKAASTTSPESSRAPAWIFNTVDLSAGGSPKPDEAQAPADIAATASVAAADGGARKRRPRGVEKPASAATVTCQWCSASVPGGAIKCPACGVAMPQAAAQEMPLAGLTEVSPDLLAYAVRAKAKQKRQSLLKIMFTDTSIPQTLDPPPPSDSAALRPPSPEVRAEMARLDAEIAAATAATAATAEATATAEAMPTERPRPGA